MNDNDDELKTNTDVPTTGPADNVGEIKQSDLGLFFDPNESKHRKARYLRLGNKHWTRKALVGKRARRRIAKASKQKNR